MTADESMRAARLAAAKRALAQAEEDLKAAGANLAAMKCGALLRGLR